ncbi:helix-turn-helix domain-containing protein [Calidifontibacillus oryziterrae]|uniref:helix-turn-helix domain-containing protein n=1 Tax=Calidifontibacillus oryziterrae TaxID=1191699 RepID=UPI0002ECEAFC|nr:LuxR C-terminal-related transcriptional regulator [Calidifontibacillus oryziterrae]
MKENNYQPKPLLTKREKEVFELLVQDKTTKEIAEELFISEKTVRNHISNTMWFETQNNKVIKKPSDTTTVGFFLMVCTR